MNELPTPSRPAPPRLRIHHLMACAAVAAIQLTLWRNVIPAGMIDQLPAWAKAANAISMCFVDVGLTFALFSVYWQLEGYAALVQPGQWLLARRLIYLAQLVFGYLVVSHLRVTGPWGKSFALWSQQDKYLAIISVLYAVLSNINHALPAIFYAWCAWRVADTRPWRIFFSLNAINSLLHILPLYRFLNTTSGRSISRVLSAEMVITSILMLSLMLWVVLTDYRRRQRYWTHWLGVGLCIAAEVLGFASGLMNWFGGY